MSELPSNKKCSILMLLRLFISQLFAHRYCFQAIPLHVLEKEGNIKVSCEFVLQTKGTEVPLNTYSLPSISKQFSTKGNDEKNVQNNI